ncbi:unnamed protein product [Arctia plantaginis]|uniref:Uncharacterized protein n=1 Tax=Arctia plantaginis TaxID=874455 RepID=A0A8S1BQ38_ARCPL|nr:unnamed protein product [Arctia plantaginis]
MICRVLLMNEDFHRDLPVIMLGKKYKYTHRLVDQVRDVVYNVYGFFTKEANEFGEVKRGYFTNVAQRVTAATGVSIAYVSILINEYKCIGPEASLKTILRNPHSPSHSLKKKAEASKSKMQQTHHPTCFNFEMKTDETLNMQYEKFGNDVPDLNVLEVKMEDEIYNTENKQFHNKSCSHYFEENIYRLTLENMTELYSTSGLRMTEGCHRDLPIIMLGKKYPHRLDDQVRDVVYNVYCYIIKEANEFAQIKGGYFSNITRRVSAATGVSASYVSHLVNEYKHMGPEAFLKPNLRNQRRASQRLKKKAEASKSKMQQSNHYTFLNFEMKTGETLNMQYEKIDEFENDAPDQNSLEVKIKEEIDITENEPFQNDSYSHYLDINIHQQTLENMTELDSTSIKIKTEDDTSFNFESEPAVYEHQLIKDEPTTINIEPDIVAREASNKNELSNHSVLLHQPFTSTGYFDNP